MRQGASPVGVFLCFGLLFFSIFVVWGLATPLMALPDEPVHAIRAVALDRSGELIGTATAGPGNANTVVTVPELYGHLGVIPGCYADHVAVTAACAPADTGTSAPEKIDIYVGRYPPLYYAIVGLPSVVTISPTGVRLMRVFSSALAAILLALAVTSIVAWSRTRLLLAGVALAATPQLFFLGGGINPSGFEVSAAICLWCSLLVLALERRDDPPIGLIITVALSASALVLARPLSPFWEVCIGLTVAVLAGWRAVVDLLRRRAVQVALALVALCGVMALAWIFGAHSLDHLPTGGYVPAHESDVSIFLNALGETAVLLRSAVGDFGWLDTNSPLLTYVVWGIGLAFVGGLATLAGRRRENWALATLIVASIIIPVVIIAEPARRYGFAGQGRDFLPLTVGVPLVAAVLAARSPLVARYGRRIVTTVAVLVASGQVFAFGEALRRNAVGLRGPINFLDGPWRPPGGALLLTVLDVLEWIAFAGVLWWLAVPPAATTAGSAAGPAAAHEQVPVGEGTLAGSPAT
jgi:hypothetical protein